MARVFVDTNVLFPFTVMDVLLGLTEDGVHEVLWTEALLTEWERVIVREQRRSAESAAKIAGNIREFFPEGRIPEHDYIHLIASMPGNDPDDRRHMAAAVAGGAETIITWNRSDFPSGELAGHGVRVMDPDEYLCELIVELPDEVVETVVQLAARKQRPPMTPFDLVKRLVSAKVPNFAVRLKDRLHMKGIVDETAPPLRSFPVQRGSRGTATATGERGRAPLRQRSGFLTASEVAGYLASKRPPPYKVSLSVQSHSAIGQDSHAFVLEAAFLEMLTQWPDGTTLVVDYPNGSYVQALTYPPHMLTEIGRLDSSLMPGAVDFGWIDPSLFKARHLDFASQPVWEENPIREWEHPGDSLQEIALFLSASVQRFMGCNPGDGYRLTIFNLHARNLEGKKSPA